MSLASLHNIKNNHFSFIVADSAVGGVADFRHAYESSSGGARNMNFSLRSRLLSYYPLSNGFVLSLLSLLLNCKI